MEVHCNKRPLDEIHKRSSDEMEPLTKRSKCSDFCGDCKGVRVFYYNKVVPNINDHSNEHMSTWNKEATRIAEEHRQICLEAGVVVNCWRAASPNSASDLLVEVTWDCGVSKTYSNAAGEWNNIRILDMGPAGYRAPFVLCDICTTPLTGFSFRCTEETCTVDENEVFDLCYKHYNESYHLDGICKEHQFQCLMQTIFNLEPQRNRLPLRIESEKFRLVGLFAGAYIAKTTDKSKTGKLQKVVHKGGNCTGEVSYEGMKELVYEDIGNKGKVDICALKPGDGGAIYADHFPTIDFDDSYILKEISKFHQSTDIQRLDSGGYCHISQDGSILTICNALLEKIALSLSSSSKLTTVDLMHNKLTTIPDELSLHKESIVSIGLSFNHFECIPELVFDFKKLLHLNVIQNQLSFIPKEIENFCNLKILFLDNNRIRMLPDELGELKNLKILGLGWNLLTSLPKTMKTLCSLLRLDLHHNQFKVFPSVLCSSELHLHTLTMDNNRIQVVPESAKKLISSLTHFTIHRNPIQQKGSLAFSNTDKLFINTIMSHDNNSKPRGTLRVLILGRSGSGKTSLAKAVVDNDYVTPIDKEEIDHTVGINQYSYRFGLGDKVYEMSLWDFAGEKCYAMMNQMFISSGSLVWLVFNMRKYTIGSKECFENNIGTWLRGVRARIGTPVVVWIIGTHEDECSRANSVKIDVEKSLKPIANDIPVLIVSNAHDLRGHCELQMKIKELPTHHAFSISFEELKPHWSTSEEYLLNLAAQKMSNHQPPILSKDEAFGCLKKEGLINCKDDFGSFMEHLHIAGEIFIFKESVYLDVVWLISLLREVFRSDLTNQLEIGVTKLETEAVMESIKTTGTISSTILLKIWKTIGVTESHLDEIVGLLIEFKLAFKVQSSSSLDDSFMFPWLLSEEGHEKITFSNISQKLSLSDHSILMAHAFDFVPPSFFEQFITSCSQMVDISKVTRHLMSADFNHLSIFILWSPEDTDPHKGYIVFAICDKGPEHSYSEMWFKLQCFNDSLQHVVQDWKGMEQPRSYVVCPQCIHYGDSSATPHLFPLLKSSTLEGREYVPCKRCKDSKREYNIPVKKLYPPQAEDQSGNDQMLDVRTQLHRVAKDPNIATRWVHLATSLGFTSDEIKQIEMENRHDVSEQCFQMFFKWKMRNGSNATVDRLRKGFEKAGLKMPPRLL